MNFNINNKNEDFTPIPENPSGLPTNKTEKNQSIEEFSWGKALHVCLQPANLDRILSMTKCWFKAQGMMLQSQLLSDESLWQKAQIKLATGIEHRFYEICATFSKMTFGEANVLVSTRNIASKEVLRNETDKHYYLELNRLISKKYSESDLVSLIGYDESYLTEESKEFIKTDAEPKSASRDGVCFSACMYLIGKILNDPNIEESLLIQHAQEFQRGVPAEVAAKQEIYHNLKFIEKKARIYYDESPANFRLNFCNTLIDILYERALKVCHHDLPGNFVPELTKVIDTTIKELQLLDEQLPLREQTCLKQILRDDVILALFPKLISNRQKKERFEMVNQNAFRNLDSDVKNVIEKALKGIILTQLIERPEANALAHLYGFKQDFEGTGNANAILHRYMDHISSKAHLSNFAQLEPGVYEASFSTLSYRHSVLYVKSETGEGYLFDPNHGLIKCGNEEHTTTFLKLFSMYPAPSSRLTNESDDRNYRLVITKFNKSHLRTL